MINWPWVLRIVILSLVSGLIVMGIVTFLRFTAIGRRVYDTLISHGVTVILLLLSLILVVPMVLSLFTGTLLSPSVVAMYVRELLISIAVVGSFSLAWIVLEKLTS